MLCFGLLAASLPTIRPFDVGSSVQTAAAAAHSLDVLCFPPSGLWSASQFAESLRSPRTAAVGAWTDDEALVGMCFTELVLDECTLTNLAVHPTLRRRGLAEALLREAMVLARTAGATRIMLEMRESNEAARTLYAKCGFVCVGRRRRYYKRPDEDALLLDAPLN